MAIAPPPDLIDEIENEAVKAIDEGLKEYEATQPGMYITLALHAARFLLESPAFVATLKKALSGKGFSLSRTPQSN